MLKKGIVLSVLILAISKVSLATVSVIETTPHSVESLTLKIQSSGMKVLSSAKKDVGGVYRTDVLVDHTPQQLGLLKGVVASFGKTKLFLVSKFVLRVEKWDAEEYCWYYDHEHGRKHCSYTWKWLPLLDDVEEAAQSLISDLERFKKPETRQQFLDDYDIAWKRRLQVSLVFWAYYEPVPAIQQDYTFDSHEVFLGETTRSR